MRKRFGWAPPRPGLLLAAVGLGLAAVVAGPTTPAQAHPLGDFTVSTHVGLRVEPAAVAVDVVLDIAEIPTLRAFPALGDGDGPVASRVPEAERRAYRDRLCPALRDAVALSLDGRPLDLTVSGSALSFPEGDGGLVTARLECALRTAADVATVGTEIVLTDGMQVQPVGWREVVAVGDGVTLTASDVPTRSSTEVLRHYPAERLQSPLDQRGARVTVAAGSGVVTGAGSLAASWVQGASTGSAEARPSGVGGVVDRLSDAMAGIRLGPGVAAGAIALAVLLGALHAFAPGHGKTLMAAYLLGRRATARQALLIGLSVTLTHTLGVLALGVAVSVAAVTAPERIYPWLGLVSGLLLVGIGASLLRSALRGDGHGHGHSQGHGHGHSQGHGHGHSHGHGHGHGDGDGHAAGHARGHRPTAATGQLEPSRLSTALLPARAPQPASVPVRRPDPGAPVPGDSRISSRSLVTVGLAGGMVPTPSALVVLLGGVALGRAWFGVLLVLAYGLGMAAALVGTGLLLARARDRVQAWSMERRAEGSRFGGVLAVAKELPVVTAGAVIVIGLALAARALADL